MVAMVTFCFISAYILIIIGKLCKNMKYVNTVTLRDVIFIQAS